MAVMGASPGRGSTARAQAQTAGGIRLHGGMRDAAAGAPRRGGRGALRPGRQPGRPGRARVVGGARRGICTPGPGASTSVEPPHEAAAEGRAGMTIAVRAAPDRYDTMAYRRVGTSGLHLPAISLGLWQNFGDDRPLATQRAIVLRAFDRGVTHFDLANNYGPPPGSAETNFGQILGSDLRGYRDELVISTKAGYDMWPGPYGDAWLAQIPAGQPRPEPRPDGSRLRRHLLFPPRRSGHASGRDDGCSRQRRPQGKALYVGISSYSAVADARGRGDPARSRDAVADPSAVLLDAEPLDRDRSPRRPGRGTDRRHRVLALGAGSAHRPLPRRRTGRARA